MQRVHIIHAACTSIEACLSHELENDGNLQSKLEQSGYISEADGLRKIRNAIIHKNDDGIVQHHFSEDHEKRTPRSLPKSVHPST